jgi:hypothetical protein
MATLLGGDAHNHARLGQFVKKSSAYNSGQNGRMAGSPVYMKIAHIRPSAAMAAVVWLLLHCKLSLKAAPALEIE